MKKTILIIVMAVLCLNFTAKAQDKADNFIPLKIGDKVPDVVLTNIMNSRAKSFKLSDYRGKLVLIDFWTTWCSTCIKAFPEMDSLQTAYSSGLRVFLVNAKKDHNTEQNVKMIIDRVNAWNGHRLKLPVVFQDTAISKYILFQSVPTYAWIGPDGRLLAVTGKDEVTSDNIAKAIKGEPIHLKLTDEYNFPNNPPKH